jgi:hypothetical protein
MIRVLRVIRRRFTRIRALARHAQHVEVQEEARADQGGYSAQVCHSANLVILSVAKNLADMSEKILRFAQDDSATACE